MKYDVLEDPDNPSDLDSPDHSDESLRQFLIHEGIYKGYLELLESVSKYCEWQAVELFDNLNISKLYEFDQELLNSRKSKSINKDANSHFHEWEKCYSKHLKYLFHYFTSHTDCTNYSKFTQFAFKCSSGYISPYV
jgi:hypothetical protein